MFCGPDPPPQEGIRGGFGMSKKRQGRAQRESTQKYLGTMVPPIQTQRRARKRRWQWNPRQAGSAKNCTSQQEPLSGQKLIQQQQGRKLYLARARGLEQGRGSCSAGGERRMNKGQMRGGVREEDRSYRSGRTRERGPT